MVEGSPEQRLLELQGLHEISQAFAAMTDIEETCHLLRDLKVPIIEPPALIAPGTWRARLRDPDGHEVELLQYPTGAG